MRQVRMVTKVSKHNKLLPILQKNQVTNSSIIYKKCTQIIHIQLHFRFA